MKTINNAKSKYMCGSTTSDVIVIMFAYWVDYEYSRVAGS